MAKSSTDLPHDFADRMMCETLSQPDNLRELVARVIPDLAPQLDFPKTEPVPRTFLLDDYRERREGESAVRDPPGRAPGPPAAAFRAVPCRSIRAAWTMSCRCGCCCTRCSTGRGNGGSGRAIMSAASGCD